ncbi:radical SAM protein [Streptosporangium sp. CA-115845]|uniref:radical SAM protein n=1 Tax=Streptosporangium sp. CA-115845 TaxID=3240071 RepID=UPI003D93A7B3
MCRTSHQHRAGSRCLHGERVARAWNASQEHGRHGPASRQGLTGIQWGRILAAEPVRFARARRKAASVTALQLDAHPGGSAPLRFLWLEVSGKCQLTCLHCYANASPQGTDGVMTPQDWTRVIDEAAALGVRLVQFIGGEPTLYRPLPDLIGHALAAGVQVEVYSNLGAPRGAPSYPRLSREELKGGSWA